ncbi:MAG TPA: hypothetical protein GXX50_11970 [Firmicutes bacterium]|nr:hypothetical protein [Bacillota bacterium]
MSKRIRGVVAVAAAVLLLLSAFPALAAPQLSDVTGHWAADAIQQLVEKGAISGLPDGNLRPELTVTRAEFVTMVNKSLGIAASSGTSRFSDVKGWEWFAGQVEAATLKGYVTGNPDGTFSPYRPITREQAAAMLVRAFGFPLLATPAEQDAALAPFSDAGSVSPWAKGYLATAISLGLVEGYNATTLAPQPVGLSQVQWQVLEAARNTAHRAEIQNRFSTAGLITRAQTATIIVRALAKAGEQEPEPEPEPGVPAKLSVEAKDDTPRLNTTAKITATVLDASDQPVKDAEVKFAVFRDEDDDPEKEGTEKTDADGTAEFSYTGPSKEATDTVKVTVGDLEKEITIDWERSSGGGGGSSSRR